MSQIRRVLAEVMRIAEYHEEALREYRRLRGGSEMDNRTIAAERFIDERQYEAMRAVAAARLQREAAAGGSRAGGLSRILHAFRKVLLREATQQVPARVEIRRS